MIGLVTSCGRFDLLEKTIDSFYKNQQHNVAIVIHEDSVVNPKMFRLYPTAFTGGIGQHDSITKFTSFVSKYYLHLEDDWEFNNTYDWIQASIDIMEADPTIIKVLCNSDSPHPCEYRCKYRAVS